MRYRYAAPRAALLGTGAVPGLHLTVHCAPTRIRAPGMQPFTLHGAGVHTVQLPIKIMEIQGQTLNYLNFWPIFEAEGIIIL
jgi:hypothetical protein